MASPKLKPVPEVVDANAFVQESPNGHRPRAVPEPCPFPGCVLAAHDTGDHQLDTSEAEASDAAAVAALAEVEALAETPLGQKRQRTRFRKPPENLDEAVITLPVTLTNISVGRSIKNVTVSLTFAVAGEKELRPFMGARAYAATLAGSYIGDGLQIKGRTEAVDDENIVNAKVKFRLPRFADQVDQIKQYIRPLLPEPEALNDALLGMSSAWRINVTVATKGALSLFDMQGSMDLTGKGAKDGTNEPVTD